MMLIRKYFHRSDAGGPETRNPCSFADGNVDSGFARRAPLIGYADTSPEDRDAKAMRSPISSLGHGRHRAKHRMGRRALSVYAFLCVWPALAIAASPLTQPPHPLFHPIADDFSDLPQANDFAICVANKSYRGCCSSHLGVKDIRDDKLICVDEAPSRKCNGVAAPLKGCCSGHRGIFGVSTVGVVMCNDQTSSPSCYLGVCKDVQQESDD